MNILKGAFIALFLFLIFNSMTSYSHEVDPKPIVEQCYSASDLTECAETAEEAKMAVCDGLAAIKEDEEWGSASSRLDTVHSYVCQFNSGSYEIWGIHDVMIGGVNYGGDLEKKSTVSPSFVSSDAALVCPPDDYLDHDIPVNNEDGELVSCNDELPPECPDGTYSTKVNGQCVPVTCPDSGTQDDIWVNGSVYSNNTGTYCDSTCAFSIAGGQNDSGTSGNFAAEVVSTGSVCGQGPDEDQWQADGEGDNCSTSGLDGGGTFITCSNESTEEPDDGQTPQVEEPIDLTEQKELEQTPELTPEQEVCGTDNAACEIRNLKEKLDTENQETQNQQAEILKKTIEAQEISTNKLISTLNQLQDINSGGLALISKSVEGGTGTSTSTGGGGVGGGECIEDCDDSTNIVRKLEPSEGLTGFYESAYPDGIEGMFTESFAAYQETAFFTFLDEFQPSISGGTAPDFNICLNLGTYANFGCFVLPFDPRILPAMKIFILLIASFTCRKILFGG